MVVHVGMMGTPSRYSTGPRYAAIKKADRTGRLRMRAGETRSVDQFCTDFLFAWQHKPFHGNRYLTCLNSARVVGRGGWDER